MRNKLVVFQILVLFAVLVPCALYANEDSDTIVVTAQKLTLEQLNQNESCFNAAAGNRDAEDLCYEQRTQFNRQNEAARAAGQVVNYCTLANNGYCVRPNASNNYDGNSLGGGVANSAASGNGGLVDASLTNCYYQAGQRICPRDRVESGMAPNVANTPVALTSVSHIDSIIDRYDAECKPKLTIAERCCREPDRCIGNSDGEGSNSAILGSIQAVLGSAGQASAISGACGNMKNVALMTTALNTALARNCTSKISQCKESCNSIREEASQALAACGTGTTCASTIGLTTRSRLRVITSEERSCEANENYAQQQASQAIASAMTARTMGLCKEAATSPNNPAGNNVALNNLNIDCSNPASASNPACQNACNRAGAQNDPACNPSLSGGVGFGTGGGSALVNPNGKFNPGDGALDEIEAGQDALAEDIAPIASKVSSSSPGGGANLPGGGEDSGGGGGLKNFGASNDGGGLNPGSVGSGFRTGSGYVSSSGRSVASKGGAGFDLSAFTQGKDGGKPFNPKDFLPGGRLDPKRRLAGLGAANGEIGAVHGDIFKNITNRFYQVCLRDALMDCETLRKAGNLGK